MWIVRLALRRPYTFVAMAIAIPLLGSLAIVLTPTDIFPQINIPVGSVIWIYPGMAPDEMEGRIVTICERAMTTTVNSIEQIVPIIRYRPFRNDAPGITLEFDRRRAIR
jgi:multidrug efflux pump subunit AcrB